MNKKGKGNLYSYISVVVILVCALIFIFYLLETEKARLNAKPVTDSKNKTTESKVNVDSNLTTTTIVVDNNVGVTSPIKVEPVSNFTASIADIIGDLGFFGNYNVTTFYHGVEFTFKCNSYDEASGICSEGGALMKINDALFPLYTYSSIDGNYLLRGDEYYIVNQDDFILLYTNNFNSKNSARIFNARGVELGQLDNTLTSYKLDGEIYKKLYPNIEDGNMYYYACENNSVVVKSVILGDYSNFSVLETINGSCN